jgi:hypothetical protein
MHIIEALRASIGSDKGAICFQNVQLLAVKTIKKKEHHGDVPFFLL